MKYPPLKRYEHIREEVKLLLDKKQVLTRKQIQSFQLNSYEWYELYALFPKKELIKKIEQSLNNCYQKGFGKDFPITYEQILIQRLIPLLLEKIK